MNLLLNYRKMLAFIDPKVHEFASAGSQRSAVAGALYDVANEHAKGICLLFEGHCSASGFALLRILFETYIRASWLLHCATEKEFETFIEKDKIQLEGSSKRLTFAAMVKAVEATRKWPSTLTDIRAETWSAFNSYTHGGQLQVTRRYDGVTIQPHHNPQQEEETIQFSAMILFLTFCEIAEMSDSDELNHHVAELYDMISPWCFKS
ncbi:DUF5677 domain-containing protein [uncultured Amphritea sp.]|uniref:DUF6988 family protein n=1 Tax=uncultured Amphritea sp. TaxID=981605 RepID=UPI00263742F0|nr:DUF5677 domain-containing protein [uncultured Amphritea sp.]